MSIISIYTDGSCAPNPGPGGWAAIFVDKSGDVTNRISGHELITTNNRMELTAVVKGLTFAKENLNTSNIKVFTDSNYVKSGITIWIKTWKVKNWKTANNDPVKNQDLWRELDILANNNFTEWHWVKAHDTNTYNNMVDLIAKKETEKASSLS